MENLCLLIIKNSDENLIINKLHGFEHGLSKDYCFRLTLDIHASKAVNNHNPFATLKINSTVLAHGYLAHYKNNIIDLIAPLYLLQKQSDSFVYKNLHIVDLIHQILKKYCYKTIRYLIEIINPTNYPQKTWIQKNESDYSFLKRHLSFWGITYFYKQSIDQVSIVFTDQSNNNKTIETIPYVENSGLNIDVKHAFDFSIKWRIQTKETFCKGYNYKNPHEKDVFQQNNTTSINAHGKWLYFGPDYVKQKNLSRIRQASFDCFRNEILLKTNIYDLTPGDIIHLSNLKWLTKSYQIVNIEHFFKKPKNFTKKIKNNDYHNSITLIQSENQFRPAYEKTSSAKNLYEIACVKGEATQSPNINKDGEYYFRYDFDRNNEYSKKSRLVQPHNGLESGYHFPIYNDTKIIIGYLNNDIDHSIILGSQDHSNTITNTQQHFLQSHSKSQFLFDDENNSNKMKISALNQNFEMSSHHEHDIKINAALGDIRITSKNITENIANGIYSMISMRNYYMHADKYIKIKTTNNDISMASKKNITQKHANDFNLQGKNIYSLSEKKTKIQSSKNIHMMTESDMHIYNKNSMVNISGQNVSLKSNSRIVVSQNNAKIILDKSGSLKLKAPKIIFNTKKNNSNSTSIKLGGVGKPSTPIPLLNENEIYLVKLYYKSGKELSPIKNTFATFVNHENLKNSHISNNKGLIEIDEKNYKLLSNLMIKNQTIIKLNQKNINTPMDTISVSSHDFQKIRNIKSITIQCLYPPIIVNIRDDAEDQYARNILTSDEIEYFKQNGSNATIFIHGYNVAYGRFNKQIMNLNHGISESLEPGTTYKTSARLNDSEQTIYFDLQQYTDHSLHHLNFFERQRLKELNGTHAHNWFIHMEDNLNRATQQFDRTNYQSFTRLINIAWSGDTGVLNFGEAENNADRSAKKLVNLILQLASHNIQINIIAHSLGNRLLLGLMNQLSLLGHHNIINHVFMWQAAVEKAALSHNQKEDNSLKQNNQFTLATLATKYITILYSSNDQVVGILYWVYNYLGRDYEQVNQTLSKNNLPKNEIDHIINRLKELSHLFYNTHTPEFDNKKIEKVPLLAFELQKKLSKSYRINMLIGYNGPDLNDPFIQKKITSGKIMLVNQTRYLHEHSGMKIPDERLMNEIYYTHIWLAKDFKFGLYHK